MFQVKLEQFEGPLDLLLQLIEQEELSITSVSLATVTEGYLTAVRSSEKIFPEELADFLVIAAKLILIKSQALLPGLETEKEEGPSLEAQLRLYREFVEASKGVQALLRKKRYLFPRPKPQVERVAKFSPPPGLTTAGLAAAFREVIARLEPLFRLPKAAIERAISIQEKINRIRSLVIERISVKFGEMVKGAKSKTEVIVNFLALLELMKQRLVRAEQDSMFHEITIHRGEGSEG